MISTEERAAELYDVIRGCQMCPLGATRTNAVPGEGPLDAEVMCIGEAPGVNEDKQGRPFVGAAGQFLGELLGAAGLRRDQVYICNVLKCRPPGNRDPLPNEIEACAEYLDLQLDMVDPLVVVTLGRFSMSKWFPQQAISRIHGSVKEVDGRFIVPMYHPAAALHQGSLRQVLLDDFAKLPAIVERARRKRSATQSEASLDEAPAPPQTRSDGATRGPSVRASGPRDDAPWEDTSFGDDTEFVFDPGDEPEPPGARVRMEDAPVESAPVAHERREPQTTEPTAEQEAAPAAKAQQQLSLFE